MSRLPIATRRETWAALRTQVGRSPVLGVATVLTSLGAAAAQLVPPWVIGQIVDEVTGSGEKDRLVALTVLIVLTGVLGAVLTVISGALVTRLGQRTLGALREQAVDRALRMPTARIEEAGTGDLLSRVGDDVARVSEVVVRLLGLWVGAVFAIALTFVGLFALDPWLALAGMTALPIYYFSTRRYLPVSGARYAAERVAIAERTEALTSSLGGVATVNAYGVEAEHGERIRERSAHARDITLSVFAMFARWAKWMNIAEVVGVGAILVTGFYLVRADAVTVGAVTAAALYFHRLFNPLGVIMFTFDEVQSAGASLARIVGIAQLPPPVAARSLAGPRDGSVEVEGVSHRYGEHTVVDGVSLVVGDGERVAIVGASGAGKSTLSAVIAGLLEPASGRVLLGGVPLDDLGDEAGRHIALVSQEAHVFAGPLLEDLRLADPAASEQRVVDALDRVGAGGWVAALPDGVHTTVGEIGHHLTAEQSAQVALARLVLADPPIAILDEATAEAGSAGARVLEDAVLAATEGRTSIVVAHRLSQALTADRVVVMDAGRVVEVGTHAELVAANGYYAKLWRAWHGDAL